MMRIVKSKLIKDAVRGLCIKANTILRKDILSGLRIARRAERNKNAKNAIDIIIKNALIAKAKGLPICQDTGMVAVYLNIGQRVHIQGNFKNAVNKAVAQAYREGYFRKSVVKDPLIRKNTNTNLPAIIYTDIVAGNKVNIRLAIKGFGCENVSRIKMFMPTAKISEIEDFIVNAVKEVGSRPCPPIYIGIGIGGTLDKAVALSRDVIFRPVRGSSRIPIVARMERSILKKVNKLGIGPAGVSGKTTALGVSILTFPTHIAGLPVAVNISCHATRTKETTI